MALPSSGSAHPLADGGRAAFTGYEGWLGGRVVAHELAPSIVTAHLVVAIVIVLLLLYATVYAIYPTSGAPRHDWWRARTRGGRARGPRRRFLAIVAATMLVTLAQVALGTQVRGTVDDALQAGVARQAALGTVGAFDSVPIAPRRWW